MSVAFPLVQISLLSILIVIAFVFVCAYLVLKWKRKEFKFTKKVIGALILTVVLMTMFICYRQVSFQQSSLRLSMRSAVIVNQAITVGYSTVFVSNATSTLKEAGFAIDYYGGENVTVDFFKNLPLYGYEIIILRTHTRIGQIYTGEEYSHSEYIHEQLTGQLYHVAVTPEEHYFAITNKFIKNSMRGSFSNAVIIMMGCDGLKDITLAKAFLDKGARVCIGWCQTVLAFYTDKATQTLLGYLLMERKTVKQSIVETMEEVGEYPVLAYYPKEAGETTIT